MKNPSYYDIILVSKKIKTKNDTPSRMGEREKYYGKI